MKIILDYKLPLNKTIEITTMTIVDRVIFYENNKYRRNVYTNYK